MGFQTMAVFELASEQFSGKKIDYAKELNPEQLRVVEGGDGRVLVLAGAGSGKTRTLVYRVAWLLEHGVRPDEILLLTFTNKAAREMLDRVGALLGRNVPELWGGTFHHVAHRLLRMYPEAVHRQRNFTILDEDDAKDMLKRCLKESGIDTSEKRFPSPAVIKAIGSYAVNASRPLGDVVESKYSQFAQDTEPIRAILQEYGRRKEAANAFDFDDLLLRLRELLAIEEYRERLSRRFRYVLVDEFQDTNALQSAIVDALSSTHQNLLVVGDDAQSIYSFRAADIKNILSYPKRYPETKTFKLETNYRSTPEILDVANEVIANNTQQFPKELKAVVAKGEKPFVVAASSAREEAAFVSQMIAKINADGRPLSELAVLFRASHHSQQLEFELTKRGIQYEYRGGLKFFERAHIKDALSFARIVGNAQDEAAWMRLLSLGKGIGEVAAKKIFGIIRQAPSLEDGLKLVEVGIGARAKEGWREIVSIVEAARKYADDPSELIRSVIEAGYRQMLTAEYPNYEERLDDLEQLAVFAANAESLELFLGEVSLYDSVFASRSTADETTGDRLVLSTIHQAKGLEWHTVFLIHVADQYFPNKRALSEAGGLDEERRLFYVAVTRAQRKLFLSYPAAIGDEYLELVQPSIFLDEISPRLIENLELQYAKPQKSFSSSKYDNAGKTPTVWKSDDDFFEDTIIEAK